MSAIPPTPHKTQLLTTQTPTNLFLQPPVVSLSGKHEAGYAQIKTYKQFATFGQANSLFASKFSGKSRNSSADAIYNGLVFAQRLLVRTRIIVTMVLGHLKLTPTSKHHAPPIKYHPTPHNHQVSPKRGYLKLPSAP